MANKLIIQNDTDMSDLDALAYVKMVIGDGRISESRGRKQYYFHTTFKSGVHVSAFLNKKSDRFVILQGEQPNRGQSGRANN